MSEFEIRTNNGHSWPTTLRDNLLQNETSSDRIYCTFMLYWSLNKSIFARPTSNIQKCIVVVKLMEINFYVSELFRCYIDVFLMFFPCFVFLYCVFSIFLLLYVLSFYVLS